MNYLTDCINLNLTSLSWLIIWLIIILSIIKSLEELTLWFNSDMFKYIIKTLKDFIDIYLLTNK